MAVLHTSSEHGLSDERIASQMERCSGANPVFYQDKIAALFNHVKSPDAASLAKVVRWQGLQSWKFTVPNHM